LATDNNALENLKAALATFDNANMDLELITGTKLWDVFAQRGCIYRVKNVHIFDPFVISIKHTLWRCRLRIVPHAGW
jgi:hypothetical protein